jgi:predicted nucleotidyltransferase
MKPSEALERHRPFARPQCVTGWRNPRVFGSVARGTDGPGSDLDVLVEPLPRATLFDVGGFQDEGEQLLGVQSTCARRGIFPLPSATAWSLKPSRCERGVVESRLREHLGQMLTAAREVLEFVGGMDREAFTVDRRTQQAVVITFSSSGRRPRRSWTRTPRSPGPTPKCP